MAGTRMDKASIGLQVSSTLWNIIVSYPSIQHLS